MKRRKKADEIKEVQGPICVNDKGYQAAMKDKTDYFSIRKYYERDSTYLGLMDSFMQDGPQLILQIYIIAVRHEDDLNNGSTGNIKIAFFSYIALPGEIKLEKCASGL